MAPSRDEHLFDEMKRYVGFGPEDEARLHAVRPRALPHIGRLIDDFYDHILNHPGAKNAITGGDAQVQRLKGTLRGWLTEFFQGPWDEAYYERRARIGRRHVQINLPQQYMFTAVNVIRGHVANVILDSAASPEDARAELHAVDKLLDMELGIMLHTYREDYLLAMQRSERLATFGQLVASIGHELRNPLGVMESSLFLLRGRVGGDEKVTRHLDKIEAQIQLSNRIVTDLLDIVRDRPAKRHAVQVAAVIEAASEGLNRPEGSKLEVKLGALPPAHVDPDQLRQLLANLLQNAFDAAGPGCEVRVDGRADGGRVVLRVSDSGPGIDPSIRARLFEPLVTTKVRGIGLGLALCRRLAERNGATLALVEGGPLPGATFELRLDAAENGR